MIAQPIARLQGLDKTTARVSQFEVPVSGEARFGTLSIWVRACKRSPPEESPENAAFLEIFENRPSEAKVRIFNGWMFSSSPACRHSNMRSMTSTCSNAKGRLHHPFPLRHQPRDTTAEFAREDGAMT